MHKWLWAICYRTVLSTASTHQINNLFLYLHMPWEIWRPQSAGSIKNWIRYFQTADSLRFCRASRQGSKSHLSLEAQLTALWCCVMLEPGGGGEDWQSSECSFNVEAAINPQTVGGLAQDFCCSASLWHLINGHHNRVSEPRLYICLQGMMQVFMKLTSPRFLTS